MLNNISYYLFRALVTAAALATAGCAPGIIPSFRQPTRLYEITEEEANIKHAIDNFPLADINTIPVRNSYITLRMYSIDMEYTKYEASLTHENEAVNFASTVTNLGLTGAASVIPAGQTTKVLSAAATALTGTSAAYDKDILLAQAIQNIQTAMRANRNDQATKIIANMTCDYSVYPIGMALLDLEDLYRAGTLTAGLIGVTSAVNKTAADAKTQKDSVNPAPAVHVPAQATIASTGQNIVAQAAGAKTQTANHKNPCPLIQGLKT